MIVSLKIIIEFVILLFLLFFSAFFSGSETALLSLNKIRIKKLAREGNKNAIIVEELINNPETLLATILVGNNLVNIAAASIATAIAIEFFGSKGIGIATGVLTFVILVFGEIAPKSISAENAERISLLVAKPIKFFIKFFSPLVYILTLITGPVTKRSGKHKVMITEDEIRLLVEMGEKEGVIEKEEKEMIKGVFEVGDMVAKEVMIPRVDMVCIEVNESIDEALKLIRETGFSRIPVYEGNRDNIVGILYAKDIIRHLNKKIKIKDIMRPPFFIPETKSLRELLREMQKLKLHMAIVVDEYGGTAGLVTLEDIIEEIVGEIMDEVDEEEELIRRIDENTWLVNARARIEEVNEILNLEIPEDEFETIGGFVFNKLGKIPKIGDYIEIDGVKITVEKMKDKRIRKVRITVNR